MHIIAYNGPFLVDDQSIHQPFQSNTTSLATTMSKYLDSVKRSDPAKIKLSKTLLTSYVINDNIKQVDNNLILNK
jgi:Cu/Ag efflux pump CusA